MEAAQLAGTVVFAISGVLAVADRRDGSGSALLVGVVTALGGGTLRDLVLGATPVLWVDDTTYLFAALAGAVAAIPLARELARRSAGLVERTIRVADAAGLGLFAIVGADVALELGFSAPVAIVTGLLSGAGGGVLRDLLAGRRPLIMGGGNLRDGGDRRRDPLRGAGRARRRRAGGRRRDRRPRRLRDPDQRDPPRLAPPPPRRLGDVQRGPDTGQRSSSSPVIYIALTIVVATAAGIAAERRWPERAGHDSRRALLWILYLVLPPVTFFNLVHVSFDADLGGGIGLAWIATAVAAGVAYLVGSRLLDLTRPQIGAVIACTLVANTAYLGYPLTIALLGSDQLGEAVAYDVAVGAPALLLGRVLGRRRVRDQGRRGRARSGPARSSPATCRSTRRSSR